MGLYGVMRTGVSGMNAQSSKLGTVADNIANSSTTGYKRAASEFSSLVLSQGSGTYNSGGVEAQTKYAITDQGALSYTTSSLDLAVEGNGFFVVSDKDGSPMLTRAGSFVPTDEGYLINTAGYYLQGYPITNGATPTTVANGLGGMERINISRTGWKRSRPTKRRSGPMCPKTRRLWRPRTFPPPTRRPRPIRPRPLWSSTTISATK